MKVRAKKNPIIPKLGVCDPHVHIFKDRAYLYASHDVTERPIEGDFFMMRDWEIWSSDDLVTWERESVIRPEDTPMGASPHCWAVDAAEKNGKYYLYVSNGMTETYVLESDDPGKGFVEKLGKPILPQKLTPTCSYDPAVFVDEDGAAYIIFGTPVWAGGDSYYIAKLNEDMVSLAEAPRKVEVDNLADDKPFLHKYKDTYYLSWASFYATSENVYGPYKFRGNIGLTTDHGSFFEWNGQWYMAFTVDESIQTCRRATGLAYIHYRENGEMCADMQIREYGVGQYNAEWNTIEAEWYTKGYHVEKKENAFNHFDVVLNEGSWVEYPNIYNMPENPWLFIRGVSEEDVDMEVYEGDTLLGVLRKPKSGVLQSDFAPYNSALVQLPLSEGTHSIRLVAKGKIRLDSIRFMKD